MMFATLAVMTACNNEVLTDDLPPIDPNAQKSVIGFRSWNNNQRSAGDYELEEYHSTFVVYGTKCDELDAVQTVFDAVTCTYDQPGTDITGQWKYTPARYWDKQAKNYKFVAYTPTNAPIEYSFTGEVGSSTAQFKSTAPLKLKGTNLQQGDPQEEELNVGFTGDKDLDVMITKDVNTVTSFPSSMPDVDLVFGHTLSKLVVSIVTPFDSLKGRVIINNVTVKDYLSEGTFALETDKYVWTADAQSSKINYSYTSPVKALAQDTATCFIESLIFPQALTPTQQVVINYTIVSADGTYSEDYNYKVDVNKIFTETTNYKSDTVYNIEFTINPEKNVIKFDAGVYEWSDKETGEKEL